LKAPGAYGSSRRKRSRGHGQESRWESTCSTQRGAASVEALALLPFFFIVWGCIFFVHRLTEGRIVVSETARACAWADMTTACTQPRSPRCTYSPGLHIGDEDLGDAGAMKLDLERRLRFFEIDLRAMYGPEIARPTFVAERRSTAARPRVLGGGEMGVRGRFSAMCNEIPAYQKPEGDQIDIHRLLVRVWCRKTGWC
jgi:hypothetical protein